ncbi:MAG TPA: hypothetical protein VFO25_03285 [Candidatus Eremiobacteraceae bacterium]|nr:hypothetical protein [Candidatus Eremiobacteraceae bacterium]
MRDAMASGQREAISDLLTPAFVSVDVRGKESTGEQMIDLVLRLNVDRSKRIAKTTLVSIEEASGVARVLQHYDMTTTANVGPLMPKKLQALSADTWVNCDGTWLSARTQTLEVESISGSGVHKYVKARLATKPPTRFPLFVTARMWEYIEPIARGNRYEYPLDAFLTRSGLGEIDGGGTQIGGRPQIEFVDVTFWLKDSDEARAGVTDRLSSLVAPVGSELQYSRGKQPFTIPFGSTECVAIFLDGVSLPAEVYQTQDVNKFVGRLKDALHARSLGEFRSHWRGPRETALFFYGADAGAMKDAMMPVLAAEPLCQNAEVVERFGRHPRGTSQFRMPLHQP